MNAGSSSEMRQCDDVLRRKPDASSFRLRRMRVNASSFRGIQISRGGRNLLALCVEARIQEAEDSMQAQHLIIEALVEEKDGLIQTIQGLQEANSAPAPFDDEWKEESEEQPEEEEIEEIPLGEGEIDDE
ncbi:Exocyst complex component [Dorcoceras hygrometricum]|uniref:Exocyst complex component n=1 Tax=Dorcoceras hygrometricum TaxID=472368 RepID=A0A2Z7ABG4_9LAMI|nr:Exocyst complex component [Dorcoceras hygrometricum]